VSPLSSERCVVTLSPTQVCVGEKNIACDPSFGAEPWQGALAALKEAGLGKAKVTVVLSNHFVRYALVPWSSALGGPAEEDAYVRHHFVKIYGERAKAWTLRASPAPGTAPRLASAIDSALLKELQDVFAKLPGTRLASVQPQLMAGFNRLRKAIPAGGAWLVLAEPERACVALHDASGWRAVHNGKEPWLALLERERHRIDGPLPSLVLLSGAAAPSNSGEWQFRELAA
jgi:hypothetical protein